MQQGTVLWFNAGKGFGFVKPDSGEKDYFVHHTAISMSGYRQLKEGQRVTFEVGDGPKGRQAVNVQVVSESV
jgi:CspA family cold shock protein